MDIENELITDLKDLLFVSKFLMNKKALKKDRKNVKKMLEHVERGEINSIMKDDYDDEDI